MSASCCDLPFPDWVSRDQSRVTLEPSFLEGARNLGWLSLDGLCTPCEGTPVRTTPNRITTKVETGAMTLYRKVHLKGWSGAGLRDRLRLRFGDGMGPALTEFQWGRTLDALGISVPRPLMLADEGVADGRSVLVTEAVPGGTSLDRIGEEAGLDSIGKAAHLVGKLHRAGLVHRDLYLNHLILSSDGSLYLTDLQRLIRPALFFERWRVKDLAALLHSAPGWADEQIRLRFMAIYCKSIGLTSRAKKRSLIKAVIVKERRVAAHRPVHG